MTGSVRVEETVGQMQPEVRVRFSAPHSAELQAAIADAIQKSEALKAGTRTAGERAALRGVLAYCLRELAKTDIDWQVEQEILDTVERHLHGQLEAPRRLLSVRQDDLEQITGERIEEAIDSLQLVLRNAFGKAAPHATRSLVRQDSRSLLDAVALLGMLKTVTGCSGGSPAPHVPVDQVDRPPEDEKQDSGETSDFLHDRPILLRAGKRLRQGVLALQLGLASAQHDLRDPSEKVWIEALLERLNAVRDQAENMASNLQSQKG